MKYQIRKGLAAGCILLFAATAQAGDIVVTQSGFSFSPADIVVEPGDTITWMHTSGTHTVTSGTPCTGDGRFDADLTAGNPTVQYTVPTDEPDGVIEYFCQPHCISGMTGTITVVGPAPIPTMSQWGVAALGLMLLAAGTVLFTRRRAAAI